MLSTTAAQTHGVLAALLMESEQLLGVAPLDDDEYISLVVNIYKLNLKLYA